MATYKDIVEANKTIVTTDIKGKEYAEVNQRIKAFRMVYPEGTIKTRILSNEDGVCIFEASVYSNADTEHGSLLGTGHAYEKESSSFINKTSYIENCETSAVGRALGMCGFGIDVSVASAEEVQNAINNQNKQEEIKDGIITPAHLVALRKRIETAAAKGKVLEESALCSMFKVAKLEDLKFSQLNKINELMSKNGV